MTRKTACLATMSLLLGITACSHERRVEAGSRPSVVEEAPDASTVQVDRPEQFQLVQVQTRRLTDELNVNGSVAPDVSRTVPVNALTGGRVLQVFARLGDDVKKGQPLLQLLSSDLTQAISDYRKFQADELLARRSLDRARALFERGALAEKDLQAADSVQAKAKVDVESATERLRILGGDLNQLSPVITITAPASHHH